MFRIMNVLVYSLACILLASMPLMADNIEMKRPKKEANIYVPSPSTEHLFDSNTSTTNLTILTNAPVPFNQEPSCSGHSIKKVDDTTFSFHERGSYLVYFIGYSAQASSVELQLNETSTGPVATISEGGGTLALQQIIDAKHGDLLSVVSKERSVFQKGTTGTISIIKIK